MARIIFSSPARSPLPHLFIINHNVGRHGANHRHDVLLVQFFLRSLLPAGPGQLSVPIDGICGPATIKAIKYFQLAGVLLPKLEATNGGQHNFKQIGLAARPDGSVRQASTRTVRFSIRPHRPSAT